MPYPPRTPQALYIENGDLLSMVLRIKASSKEHEAACSEGCVYGRPNGHKDCFAYAELGAEDESYVPNSRCDSREEHRLFTNCRVYFATTEENLNEGKYEREFYEGKVLVFK